MNYKELAKNILELIGGKENMSGLTHCATRLRFNLKDEKKAKSEEIKKLKGVMGVVSSGGQYQIIIGSDVGNVYKPLVDMANLQDMKQESNQEVGEKKSLGASAIDLLSGIFTPILPILTAAGMLKAILALLTAFHITTTDQQVYQIINFMADAAFYFLPIFLANSAAKKFKCSPYLAMLLGGILLHPNFIAMVQTAKETGEAIKFVFLPVYPATYTSSVVPIILTVFVMSRVERVADKISPKMIKFFTVPLIVVLVTGLLSLIVLGPIGYILGNGIAAVITFLETTCGWLVPMILGGVFPLLVMTGTHYGIIPIGQNNLMTLGYDTFLEPANLASNIAQGGATLAVAVKTKNSEMKQLASSAGITAVCGITEPALYGVNIRLKTPLYASMIGGAIGGLFMGLVGVRRFGAGSPGLMTLPVYLGGETMSNFFFACIGVVISFVIGFIVSYILYKEKEEENKETKKEVVSEVKQDITVQNDEKGMKICAPITGKAVSLKEVNDPTFAEEILGKGVAIIPEKGVAVSPIHGTVINIFDTLHAIGLKSDDGVEVLIHIGLDTVKLGGKHFKAIAKSGDRVTVGTPLVEFDIDKIKEEGYDVITPMIISNSFEYGTILSLDGQDVVAGDEIMKIIQ